MELVAVVREAIETQLIEHEPAQAAQVLNSGVRGLGPVLVVGGLIDAAALALRRMVADTDETLDRSEVLAQLAVTGAVPEEHLELLGELLTAIAATAGGLRPPIEPLLAGLGAERLLFGAWLATLATIKVVSLSLERTEADVADEILTMLPET
jgi:hypothetical protein